MKNIIRLIFCFSFLQVPACSLLKKSACKKEKTAQKKRVPQSMPSVIAKVLKPLKRMEGNIDRVIDEMKTAHSSRVLAVGLDFRKTGIFPFELVARKASHFKYLMNNPPESEIKIISLEDLVKNLNNNFTTGLFSRFDLPEGLKQFHDSNFTSANLAGEKWAALMKRSKFNKSSLHGSHLVGDFSWTFFDNAKGHQVELIGDFTGSNFKKAKMPEAVFAGQFTNASYEGAKLQAVRLEGIFDRAVFEKTDLRNARVGKKYGRPVARYAKFEEADMRGMDLGEWDLEVARFIKVKLHGADLSKTKNLKTALFRGIEYDKTTKWPPGFELILH